MPKKKVTPQERIEELEEALFEIHAHQVNIAHHRARIEIILRSLFPEAEYLRRSQGGGKNPMYAEDVYKMLRARFEPSN